MKGVLDSIELRMLRRVDYVREHNFLRETMLKAERNAVNNLSWMGYGRAHSLLSLAFAA